MPALPSSLALTSIGAGATILSADHRNNYAAVQAAVNAVITALGVTAKGDLLVATASGTILNVAVGANGTITVADSTQTAGVKWAFPPGYELGYTEFTAPVSITATTEASPNNVVSAGALTFDGTAHWFEFHAAYADASSVTSNCLRAGFYDGTTSQGKTLLVENAASPGDVIVTPYIRRKLTPSAGSHTFKVAAWIDSGTGTIGAGAGGSGNYVPGYIRITKA